MSTNYQQDLFDKAMSVKTFLTQQQSDAVQNMMTQFFQRGELTQKQEDYLKAIIKAGVVYMQFHEKGENDE